VLAWIIMSPLKLSGSLRTESHHNVNPLYLK
jgi:hypothetical protein